MRIHAYLQHVSIEETRSHLNSLYTLYGIHTFSDISSLVTSTCNLARIYSHIKVFKSKHTIIHLFT